MSSLNGCRKEGKKISPGLALRGKIWALGFLCLVMGSLGTPHPGWGLSPAVEVRRVGISQVGDTTMLTVVLDRALEGRITTRVALGKPQMVVDFPQARAGRLTRRLEGDGVLVDKILTEVSPGEAGVRIILELFPDRPYTFWKKSQKGAAGQVFFLVGLKQEAPAPQREMMPRPEPPAAPELLQEMTPEPPPAGREDYGYKEPRGTEAPGSFAELLRLLPKAAPLVKGLESDGWIISEFHNYDRPGQRFSRDFLLTQQQYPELAIRIAYLPANVPNTPDIGIISLSSDRLAGETATKYRELRQWNFAKIKQHYEDIGDFFDEALKPLRIKLREETKTLALRQAEVFQNFLKRACPQNPQVAERVMAYIKEKVNQRFEGVQYTVSEAPLIILNMVDFLFVKVYFLENR
ncbi:MAG: hypothetical protein Q8M54_08445 [Desulfobaccales bacterium]|nr:hypothetical protein [Desulfobaccales bacterium]